MNIISLNIRRPGRSNAQALLYWLAIQSPDVVVLLEWCDSASGKLIRRHLAASGFHVATTFFRSRVNGILLATKDVCQTRRVTPENSDKGELLLTEVSRCNLLAAYFPQKKAKIPFFNICLQEAESFEDVPFLLLGDLNTGRNDFDVEGTGTPFDCADLFGALQTKGRLVDLWRLQNGDQREWSWHSGVNGFRLDHALANRAFLKHFSTIQCVYDHGPREIGFTDHSALIVRCVA